MRKCEWITKGKFKKTNQSDRRLKKLQNCKLAINQIRQKKKRKQNIGKRKRDQRQAVNELKEEDEQTKRQAGKKRKNKI